MSDVHQNSETTSTTTNESEEYIEKTKYKKSLDEMHAAKATAKELKAKLDELMAEKEAKETATLHENEKWKELFQRNEEKIKKLESERDAERSRFIDTHKKNAVVQELGGFKRPEYLTFIDVSKVVVTDDGELVPESIANEVQRLRKEHPELIKASDVKPLPSSTPKNSVREYGELSEQEKMRLKFELSRKK